MKEDVSILYGIMRIETYAFLATFKAGQLLVTQGGKMKKRGYIGVSIAILLAIVALLVRNQIVVEKKAENVFMESVNLEAMDEVVIGSEPPKLLYADQQKVIFECCGVFVYDITSKKLVKTFDVQKLVTSQQMRWNCFVSEDGNQILFHIGDENGSVNQNYGYSFAEDKIKKISEEEYATSKENAFLCTYLDYNDDLYQKTSGIIAQISEKEYIYLTVKDWLLNTIQIVYVKDGNEQSYPVFEEESIE